MKNPQPIPIPFPRGIFLNFSSQPLSFLTLSKHSRIPMLVTLNPVIVAEWGGSKFANLRSIGSTDNCSAKSSNPVSTAQREFTAP